MTAGPSGRRALTLVVVTIAALILIAAMTIIFTHSLQQNDSYASILSALVGLSTLVGTIVVYLRRQEQPPQIHQEAEALTLELLEQWEPEIKHRRQRFGSTKTIPLSWTQLGDAIADDAKSIVGTDAKRASVTLKLDGRLDDNGNPDRAAKRLAERFERIPSKRLVMLGEPGSGKTFLAITLAVGLLRLRVVGGPVPVFLTLSSWDPVADTLAEWIERTLAMSHYGGRERVPRALLTARMVLPILDGLDELPEHLRRQAISRLNEFLEGDRPLVLTCRSTEYKDGLAGGAPVLLRAPVVEVNPVSTNDIAAHLRYNPAWADIVREVQDNPHGPLRAALSTPLILSLFTAAYTDRDPAELLKPPFANRHAIEDHLVDELIDTVYPTNAPPTPFWRPKPWTAPQARAYLTYLAQYLHRHGERDLAWWRLSQRTLSPWIAAILGLLVGLTTFALGLLIAPNLYANPLSLNPDDPVSNVLSSPPLLGTIFGVFVGLLWLAGARRAPGQAVTGSPFRRGATAGSLLVLIPGIPLLLVSSAGLNLSQLDGEFQEVVVKSALGAALVALALISGAAVGTHELLAARTRTIGQASPEQLLRHDRRSALVAAGVTAMFVGVFSWLATTFAAAIGGHEGQRLAVALNKPGSVDLHRPPIGTHVPWMGAAKFPAIVTATILLMLLFALAVLTTRAWTRFLVARTTLAANKRLPLRLMRFLAHAHDQGLLRRSGYSYQFWHVRLQERLVSTAPDLIRDQRRHRRWRLAIVGVAVALVAAVMIPIWSNEPDGCRSTGWASVDQRMARVTMDGASACVAVLENNEWHLLHVADRDAATLAFVADPKVRTYLRFGVTIALFGRLDQIKPDEWHDILKGITIAQSIGPALPHVYFVQADADHAGSWPIAFDLVDFYVQKEFGGTTPSINIDPTGTPQGGSELTRRESIGVNGFNILPLAEMHRKSILERLRLKYISSEEQFKDECARIAEGGTDQLGVTYDFRGAQPQMQLLDRLADCGLTTILVDKEIAEKLRTQEHILSHLRVNYIEDRYESIVSDCKEKAGGQDRPMVISTCEALVAVAESFRFTVDSVIYDGNK